MAVSLCPTCLPHTSFHPLLILSLSVLVPPSIQVCLSVRVGVAASHVPLLPVSFLPRPPLSLSLVPPPSLYRALKKGRVSHCYFCLQPHSLGAGQMSLRVPHTWTIYPLPSQPPPPWLPSIFPSPRNLPGEWEDGSELQPSSEGGTEVKV